MAQSQLRAAEHISIHVLREEDDGKADRCGCCRFISIHVLREEDDVLVLGKLLELDISIHVLREEDDVLDFAEFLQLVNFYPRPPRGGRRKYCGAI